MQSKEFQAAIDPLAKMVEFGEIVLTVVNGKVTMSNFHIAVKHS